MQCFFKPYFRPSCFKSPLNDFGSADNNFLFLRKGGYYERNPYTTHLGLEL